MKILLKLVPIKEVIKLAWSIIDPLIQKKINDSNSKIDDAIYIELKIIILKLIQEIK